MSLLPIMQLALVKFTHYVDFFRDSYTTDAKDFKHKANPVRANFLPHRIAPCNHLYIYTVTTKFISRIQLLLASYYLFLTT
jgi:hypothetical protein